MSLDKAVLHGKEKRKPYRKSARFDASCRPGGSCNWCKGNRYHKHVVQSMKGEQDADSGEDHAC